MKHERNSVKHHISQKHDLTWVAYKERTKFNKCQQGGNQDMGTFLKEEDLNIIPFVKVENLVIIPFVKEEVFDSVTLKEY